MGIPKETVLGLLPVLMAGDFTYPPDNAAFEVSGVLQFVFSLPTAYFLCRFIREQLANKSILRVHPSGVRSNDLLRPY